MVICSLHHEGYCNPSLSRIYIAHHFEEGFDAPMVCLQCEKPACVAACPVEAILRNPDTGALVINQNTCVGCRMCETACPFGMIFSHDGKMVKCDLCDGEPRCVEFCETKAIDYITGDKARYGRRIETSEKLMRALLKGVA